MRIKLNDAPLTFREWKVDILTGTYPNGRLALELVSAETDEARELFEGKPITTATVNMHQDSLAPGCVYVKHWTENEGMVEWLAEHKIIDPQPIDTALAGYAGVARSYALTPDTLNKIISTEAQQPQQDQEGSTIAEYRVRCEILPGKEAPAAASICAALDVGMEGAPMEMGYDSVVVVAVEDLPTSEAGALGKLFAMHDDQPDYITAEEWAKARAEWRALRDVLGECEGFLAGFEDADDPEDCPAMLPKVRELLIGTSGAQDCYPLDDREHATVLAALRMWQRIGCRNTTPEDEIATNGGTLHELTAAEIDALCERLNFGG